MKIMQEETFGPTLPIMKVADEEEAIRLANDSTMGLDSSVFGGNTSHAEQVARRIQSGGVVVNDALTNYLAMEIPDRRGQGVRHRSQARQVRDSEVLPATEHGCDPVRPQP